MGNGTKKGGDKEESKPKNLTGKKLEAHLKREAAKQQKEAAAAERKAEAERKKEAKKATRVSFTLSTKNCQALTTSCTTAEDVLKKALDAGLAADQGQVKALQQSLEAVDAKRKDCVQALSHISKNPKGELAAFDWIQAECTADLKDLGSLTKDVRKIVTDLKKQAAEAAKASKAGAWRATS